MADQFPTLDQLLERITVDPEICFGKPCIRGMRWPVVLLLELMASDMTEEEILADHPQLEREDLKAAIAYGASRLRGVLPASSRKLA